MPIRDRLRLVGVVAVASGLTEGLVRLVTRHFPGLHAAHKVSVDILWVAPLVNLVLFAGLAVGLHIVFRFLPDAVRRHDRSIMAFLAVGIGTVAVGLAPAVLHPASVAVLGIGAGVLAARRQRSRSDPVGRRGTVGAAALLALGVAVAALSGPLGERVRLKDLGTADASAPNVIILMLDTVRRDELLGEDGARNTPRLAALARSGVRYDDAWSVTSWSLPAQATLLTGLQPRDHGADWPRFKLSESATTLAEKFAARGYATGAFSGNSSWVTPEYLGRGFLRFSAYVLEDLVRRSSLGTGLDEVGRALSVYAAGRGKKAPRIHQQMLDFLDDYPDRPFFAYLCYMDANQAIYARKFNRYFRRNAPFPEVHRAYQEGLAVLDAQIGDLLDELERRELIESTIIVVTSDHGESFGPEVGEDRDPVGHGTYLHPEQTRVPLFVVAPGRVDPGTSVDDPVSIAQIPATLASLLGWSDGMPGEPLPTGREAHAPTVGPAVQMTLRYLDRDLRSVAVRGWQYIVDGNHEGPGEVIALPGNSALQKDEARAWLAQTLEQVFADTRGTR